MGTATFGSSYGVANSGQKLEDRDAIEILNEASRLGITHLDTSPLYANAEELIGNYHQSYENKYKVYSKIPNSETFDAVPTIEKLKRSLSVLAIERFEGIYFHYPEMLKKFEISHVNNVIRRILASGVALKIGASVYTEEDVVWLTSNYPEIKLFQVPENILDRRLINSKLLENLANQEVEFQIRSVFLQGLLLMEPESILHSLIGAKNQIVQLQKLSMELNTNVIGLCLSYLKLINFASSYVVGVSGPTQLQEIVCADLVDLSQHTLPAALPPQLVDPRNWSQLK